MSTSYISCVSNSWLNVVGAWALSRSKRFIQYNCVGLDLWISLSLSLNKIHLASHSLQQEICMSRL